MNLATKFVSCQEFRSRLRRERGLRHSPSLVGTNAAKRLPMPSAAPEMNASALPAADVRITDVIAHPLTQTLPKPTTTSWGTYNAVSIVLVEVRTDAGHHRRRRDARPLLAEGLCRADRDVAQAAARRTRPARYRRPLASDAPCAVRPRRRHADRGDRRASTSRSGISSARRPGCRSTSCSAASGASESTSTPHRSIGSTTTMPIANLPLTSSAASPGSR